MAPNIAYRKAKKTNPPIKYRISHNDLCDILAITNSRTIAQSN